MLTFHRILLSAGLTLLLSATAPSLQAQIVIGPHGPLPTTAETQTGFLGGYTGTVTQTTAAGQVTTGTFTLYFAPVAGSDVTTFKQLDSGRLLATIILNGVTTNYAGRLALNSHGVRSAPGIAYLRPFAAGSAQPVPAAAKIPLFIEASLAYGGIQDEAGTSLTFRATRGSFVISTNGVKQPH